MQTVSECIVVMRGIKEVSWKSAKAMMSEANFLKSLMEMDVDAIISNQVSFFHAAVFLTTILRKVFAAQKVSVFGVVLICIFSHSD